MAILQIKNRPKASGGGSSFVGEAGQVHIGKGSGGSSSGSGSGGSTSYSGGFKSTPKDGGPFASTNINPSKYTKYSESQRVKLLNQQKMLGAAQSAMLPRIQAGPGNAFSASDLSGLHTMGMQQLGAADQQRNIGIANASAARGAGGPDIGALTASGNADANRGALAQGDLNAKIQGLNLGLGQYSAFNSAFGNVGQQQASARDAYTSHLYSMRPGEYPMQADPFALNAQQQEYNQQNQAAQNAYNAANGGSYSSFGGGGTNTLTSNPSTYNSFANMHNQQNAQQVAMTAAQNPADIYNIRVPPAQPAAGRSANVVDMTKNKKSKYVPFNQKSKAA